MLDAWGQLPRGLCSPHTALFTSSPFHSSQGFPGWVSSHSRAKRLMGHYLNTALNALVRLLSPPTPSSWRLHNHETKQSKVLPLVFVPLPGGVWVPARWETCGYIGHSPQKVRGTGDSAMTERAPDLEGGWRSGECGCGRGFGCEILSLT